MKLTQQDRKLLKRHYISITILGFTFEYFNTSPEKVIKHLKELIDEI